MSYPWWALLIIANGNSRHFDLLSNIPKQQMKSLQGLDKLLKGNSGILSIFKKGALTKLHKQNV